MFSARDQRLVNDAQPGTDRLDGSVATRARLVRAVSVELTDAEVDRLVEFVETMRPGRRS